jgi:hypothetical protein
MVNRYHDIFKLNTGLSPNFAQYSNLLHKFDTCVLDMHDCIDHDGDTRLCLFQFRSPLLTESRLILFPGVTEMFHFTPFDRSLVFQMEIHESQYVLIMAFRTKCVPLNQYHRHPFSAFYFFQLYAICIYNIDTEVAQRPLYEAKRSEGHKTQYLQTQIQFVYSGLSMSPKINKLVHIEPIKFTFRVRNGIGCFMMGVPNDDVAREGVEPPTHGV